MSDLITNIRNFISDEHLDCLLINSTNEFLVEYNSLAENSRYNLTGFSGSTGDAVVTADKVFLFVDGRYHIQADMEVDHNIVTVVKLKAGEKVIDKMVYLLPDNAVLGVVAKKNSQARVELLQKYFNIRLLEVDIAEPIFELEEDEIVDVDMRYTGASFDEKFHRLTSTLKDGEAFLLTNSEDVSYLFNKRDFSKPFASKITAKAIVTKHGAEFFTRKKMSLFEQRLSELNGKVFVDKKSINAYDYLLLKERAVPVDMNPVQQMRAVKTDVELAHYKEAFQKTDLAVRAIRDYIENNTGISEYDIAQKLEEEFIHFGAKGLSFNSIVAKDKNSALAHYSKSSRNEIVGDGSLVLIDCGAYYEGGLATDITRVFVKGEPSGLQKKVYTTVLKTFLHAFNFNVDGNTSGFDIDALARKVIAENPIEGFEFNHGLGHGIGISVHEYPPNLSNNELAKVILTENMCFTIEPGLYNKDYFGVRLENSCYLKNGKINSFVSMNYEKKLIDFNMLTEQEKVWLNDFEVL